MERLDVILSKIMGLFSGVHTIIVVGDRYHMPAIPMVAVLAAVGLARMIPVLDGGPRRSKVGVK
jgi:hypothetical protein